jgi:peroxiredoxin
MRLVFDLRLLIIASISHCLVWNAAGQVMTIEPQPPRWGDKLVVTYDTSADGAQILPSQRARLVAFVYAGDDARQQPFELERQGALRIGRIPIEDGMSYLRLYLVTPNGFDRQHTAETMVLRRDGRPARGAHAATLFAAGPERYLEIFEKEMALYPDNYAAYREKWFAAKAFDPQGGREIIEADLARLSDEIDGRPVGWMYAQAFGLMSLGREEDARAIVLDLLGHHPEHSFALHAVRSYEYEAFAQQIKGAGPEEVEAAKREAIEKHPHSPLARDAMLPLAGAADFPLDVVFACCERWIEEQPEHPMPHYVIALACKTRGQEPAKGIEHAKRAINSILEGNFSYYVSVSGPRGIGWLPASYAWWGELALATGRKEEALAAAQTAVALEPETNPDRHELLARVWREIGDFDRAAAAFAEAWAAGSDQALVSLRSLYVDRHGSEAGFEQYLARITGETPVEDETPAAETFRVTDLAGQAYDLAELRGKVVVLNFWFIGCAPCRVEMPGLNKLVAEFRKEDVVFLAFALDKAEMLLSFLKDHEFEYEIIAEADEIARLYEVQVFPTHVIIDRNGRLIYRLTGGSADRHDDLRPLIERALRR